MPDAKLVSEQTGHEAATSMSNTLMGNTQTSCWDSTRAEAGSLAPDERASGHDDGVVNQPPRGPSTLTEWMSIVRDPVRATEGGANEDTAALPLRPPAPMLSPYLRQCIIIEDEWAWSEVLQSIVRKVDPTLYQVLVYTSLAEAKKSLRTSIVQQDVIFVDLKLADARGLDALEAVKPLAPGALIAVCSGVEPTRALLKQAEKMGAKGWIRKGTSRDELEAAVRQFFTAGWYFPLEAVPEVESVKPVATFTPRERDVVRLLAEGMTAKQIAKALSLSDRTVEQYIAAIGKKFGVSTKRPILMNLAREHGII